MALDWKDVPGAILKQDDDDPDNDFSWLDDIDRDDCYMILDHQKSMKTLDLGNNGTTASLTTWHELLQLTAPDPSCGIVFVRGDFPDNAESILARAQRRNQKGAWGLDLTFPSDDYTLELSEAQGLINLRWPCTRFNIVRKGSDILFGSVTVATYTVCSFIKDQTLYQIARITPPRRSSSDAESTSNSQSATCKLTVGGTIRLGCAASNGAGLAGSSSPYRDNYNVVRPKAMGMMDTLLAGTSERHERRTEIRLWINRKQVQLQRRKFLNDRIIQPDDNKHLDYADEVVDLAANYEFDLPDESPVIVVASFSLMTNETAIDDRLQPVISSPVIQDFLGVTDTSISAPYRLWTNALDLPPDSFELNAIARSVDQILGVSSVPFLGPNTKTDLKGCLHISGLVVNNETKSIDTLTTRASEASNTDSGIELTKIHQSNGKGIALIQNIMTPQLVDLGNTLWQLRVLIRAIQFFNGYRPVQKDLKTPRPKTDLFMKEREVYRGILLEHVKGACEWILNIIPYFSRQRPRIVLPMAGILPSDILPQSSRARECRISSCLISELPTQHDRHVRREKDCRHRDPKAKDQRWCCALILWYIMCQCPSTFADQYMKERLWSCIKMLSNFDSNNREGDTRYTDEPIVCFLHWYHNHSIIKLCEVLRSEDHERFGRLNLDLKRRNRWVMEWQARTDKSLGLLGRASGRFSHQSIGYEVANLALLGEEISVVNRPLTQQYKAYLQQTKDLLTARKETRVLSPGRPDITNWKPGNFRSITPRPAPWELSCLNHLSPISLGVAQNSNDSFNDCQEFLLGDYTFMPTWDQSKIDSVGQWWEFCTSSIVGAELLKDVCDRRGIATSLSSASPIPSYVRSGSIDQSGIPGIEAATIGVQFETPQIDLTPFQNQQSAPQKSLEKIKDNTRKMLELLKEHMKDDDREGFTWTKRKPPRLYHADTSVQSLEDTPQVFQIKQTRNVEIRANFQKYLDSNNVSIPVPDWSLANIEKDLPAEKLLHVSCFDLALQADGTEYPEIGILATRGRADFQAMKLDYEENGHPISQQLTIKKNHSDLEDTSLWLLYFLGKPEKHPSFPSFPQAWRKRLQDKDQRERDLKSYQRSLFAVLNDSMVDRSTKYRVLFIQKPSPVILQALVYMWHPDALDTFDDHLGSLSKSSTGHTQSSTIMNDLNGRVDPGDVWISTITLSHWRLQSDYEKALSSLEDANDAEPGIMTDFPPHSVSDKRSIAEEGQHHLLSIREMSMSLVFTGDRLGRCWTCSIMCELIDEKAVSNYMLEIMKIQQMFIHQQYTGRSLCFILLLGYLCQSLAIECENFAEQLDKIMGMEAMVLLKGLEWHKSDIALRKLKKMLWGLEALRVFDDKLKMALARIKDSKEATKKDLERVWQDIRHRDMVKSCNDIYQEFVKRHGRLENAHNSIQQRIEQCSRLSDGITSVVSIEQNENIGMLTWINIIYLPLAFIAGIFSMGHGVVSDDASWGTFMWVIAVFIITTVFFALSLQKILASVRHWTKGAQKIANLKPKSARTSHVQKLHGGSSTGVSALESLRHLIQARKRGMRRQAHVEDVETANAY